MSSRARQKPGDLETVWRPGSPVRKNLLASEAVAGPMKNTGRIVRWRSASDRLGRIKRFQFQLRPGCWIFRLPAVAIFFRLVAPRNLPQDTAGDLENLAERRAG